jgi:MFS family permease
MNKNVATSVFPILLPYAFGYFLSYLLRNVNAVIAPDLAREMGLSAADLGLLTSAYLIGFAIVQLPLGVALDKWGARRVESALLVIAEIGCVGFALGKTPWHLALARGFIGIGVSACLMAAFKAFSQSFPPLRQASLNSSIMVAGGLGGLTASAPLSLVLPLAGWRVIFFCVAGLVLIAAYLIRKTPESLQTSAPVPLPELIKSLGSIFASRVFWRYAPQTALLIGGFVSIQGLWAMPWLLGVNGYSYQSAAIHILLLSLTLTIGYFLIATQIAKLIKRGLTVERLFSWGASAALVVSALLILGIGESHVLWILYGFFCASFNLIYSAHASHYPMHLSGRANACVNLTVFVGGFALQWGFGLVVDSGLAHGFARKEALQVAWGGLLILQVASLIWFMLSKSWTGAKGNDGR